MTKDDMQKKGEGNTTVRPRRFLTVEAEHRSEKVDLELQGDLPVRVLFPILVRALGWRLADEEKTLPYQLLVIKGEQEIVLKATDTLISAGIPNGATLRIMTGKRSHSKAVSGQGTSVYMQSSPNLVNGFTVGIPASDSPNDRRGTIAEPRQEMKISEPCLIGASGTVYPIRGEEVWVGRPDEGFRPEINLTKEDDWENPTCSRRHARIMLEDGKHVLRPRPTLNGTFVNGTQISQNDACVLKEGDSVRFGDVETTFRMP